MKIRESTPADVPAITALINRAFEVEKFFIARDRTSVAETAAMRDKGAYLLGEEEGALLACVYVEIRKDRGYFGVLSVDPGHQKRGLGRTLVDAAEDYARRAGCTAMDIRVVNLRAELPPFYDKLGYKTIATEPFSQPEEASQPCHFLVMSKAL